MRARHAPSSVSSKPCTSLTAPLRSRRASSHSPSAVIASRRRRLWSSNSPRRTCSWARSEAGTCGAEPAAEAGLGGGAATVRDGRAWAAAVKGAMTVRNASTSGRRVARTLSSSDRIWEMVDASVRGAFCWRADGAGGRGSPPPMRAIVLPALMP